MFCFSPWEWDKPIWEYFYLSKLNDIRNENFWQIVIIPWCSYICIVQIYVYWRNYCFITGRKRSLLDTEHCHIQSLFKAQHPDEAAALYAKRIKYTNCPLHGTNISLMYGEFHAPFAPQVVNMTVIPEGFVIVYCLQDSIEIIELNHLLHCIYYQNYYVA